MDWSIILSVAAIIVSVTFSTITLLLTELQGPDVTLISSPKFEIDYARMRQKRKEQEQLGNRLFGPVSASFESKPTTFVFANHGKKAGTITRIDFKFSPEAGFKYGYRVDETKLTLLPQAPDLPAEDMPMTIESGANTAFFAITYVHTIDWKAVALADALDPSRTLEEIVDTAVRKSRENFADFFGFMAKSPTLGIASCDVTYTKGRFKTKMRTKRLFVDEPVRSEASVAGPFFAEFLENWEDAFPTRQDLLCSITNPFERLMEELKCNIQILTQITDQKMFDPLFLSTNHWRWMCVKSDSYIEMSQWYLVRCEKNLEPELRTLYTDMERYGELARDMSIRKNYMSTESLQNALTTMNKARNELISRLETTLARMKQLHTQILG